MKSGFLFDMGYEMKRIILLALFTFGAIHLSGCSVISAVATSNRMEEARAANAGKQLVPKDGGTYLIPISSETISYLGSGDTDWKINNTTFTQPKATYSVVKVSPGIFNIFGNRRVAGGGEAGFPLEIKASEAICFYVFNPISGPARIESYKGDGCDPLLRPLKNQNVIGKVD